MSFILFRKQIGQQGVLPGELLMESSDDLVAITTPGYLSINDGIQPTDVITAVYGTPLVNKQQFNPVISGGVITLVAIGGGGSINGATNLPGDEPIFASILGDNLAFKSLTAGANITLSSTGDTITIAATGSGGGTITGIVDVGTGEGHISAGTAGTNIQVKTLKAGSNTVITEDSNTVTIASTAGNNGLTTLANLPGGEGIFAGLSGTIAQLKSIAAGAGIGVSASGNNVIITNTGGSGSSFLYDNAQWVAKNGNDSNSGRSIDTPKLTVQAAITALGGNGIVHIEDNGTYTGAWNIGTNDITIYAPAAFLSTTGITAGSGAIFKVNAYSFGSNFNNIISTNGVTAYINAEKVRGNFGNGVSNATQLFITAQEITGDYTFVLGSSTILSFGSMAGDIIDTSSRAPSPNIGIFGKNISGNISSVNSNIYGNLPGTNQGATITGIRFGNFGNLIDTVAGGFSDAIFIGGDLTVESQSVRTAVAGSLTNWALARGGSLLDGYVFKMEDSGKLFTYGGNDNITVFAPSDATVPWLPSGWFVYIQQDDFAGRVIVDIDPTGDSGSIVSSGGGNGTQGRGSIVSLNLIRGQNNASSRVYGLSGQTNGSFSAANRYYSAVFGDNSIADGTQALPFKDPTSLLAYIIATYTATPAFAINMVALDDAVYGDKLDFTGTTNINIFSPTALFQRVSSGVGDDTITTDNPQQLIVLGELACSGGGFALNNTGTGVILCNIDIVIGGADNSSTGQILLQSYTIGGNLPNSGGGRVRYTTMYRNSGTDGPDAIGTSVQGASGDWDVAGAITADVGNITATLGNVHVLAGDINASVGTIQAFAGNIVAGSSAGTTGNLVAWPPGAGNGGLTINATANTANVFSTITNQASGIASTFACPKLAFANVTLLATTLAQTDPNSNLIYFDTTVTAADLAGGASVPLVSTFFSGQYRVRELYLNINGTNFTVGDRLLNVTDGTNIYSVIPSTALLTLTNSRWGDANLPAPVIAGWNTLTQPGANLSVVYNAGTTDYATGSVTISGVWEKVL